MQFRRIEEEEWQDLRSSAHAHDEIRRRAIKLIEQLGMVFNEKAVGGVSGLSFEPNDDPEVLCKISTPCGSARLLFDWAMRNGSLHGVLFVERKRRDRHDNVLWEKVTCFVVPERDKVFVETPSDGFHLRAHFGNQLESELVEIGMIIFFAIVSGPAVKA